MTVVIKHPLLYLSLPPHPYCPEHEHGHAKKFEIFTIKLVREGTKGKKGWGLDGITIVYYIRVMALL